jgi:lipopolysaccharide/colanic/teichoic acid biosynthesis glycosyltransferase
MSSRRSLRRLQRRIERGIAGAALVVLSPLLAAIAVAIRIADPGPVFYPAERVGLRGARFRMYKFRTMRVAAGGSRITAEGDPRIFPFGRLLRRLKLDELPQLINIIRGEMAFVGPRPEDPWIVAHFYTDADRETLNVLPGLTSPGTIYYCAQGEAQLEAGGAEAAYIAGPLRRKLELDRAWMRETSSVRDLQMVIGTVIVLANLRRAEASGRLKPGPTKLGFAGDPEK